MTQAANIRDGQQVEVVEVVSQTVVKKAGKPKRKANKSKVG
ncbi:hypothetical protein [Alkalinema sp. FACHB-956]|nr:hypothetical protein [Alkalinema sp. FACHB-956]